MTYNKNTGNRNTGNRNTGYFNTGNWNTGNKNTGNGNTGYFNTGNKNTGYFNTGEANTGDWNSCNYETGFFNTEQPDIVRVFNKPCNHKIWDNAVKPEFLYFANNKWIFEVDMTDHEKTDNPTFHTTGGYLKSFGYKEAFKNSWNNASDKDKEKLRMLPNFDAEVFFEISGIDVNAPIKNPREIIIDGAVYILKSDK